jgi:hypothetical protein
MSVIIPNRPDLTWYDMQVVLENVTYTLEFRWNTRESAWYMDLKAEDDDPIVTSVKIVVDFPLCARLNDPRRPSGYFLANDTTNLSQDPGIADLGDRVRLLYFTADEIAAELDG